jgi:hypothetical protein
MVVVVVVVVVERVGVSRMRDFLVIENALSTGQYRKILPLLPDQYGKSTLPILHYQEG